MIKKKEFYKKEFNNAYIPSLVCFILFLLSTYSDVIISGLMLDENSMQGISLVIPLGITLLFFSLLIAFGTTFYYIKKRSKYNEKDKNKVCGEGLCLSIIVAILFAVLLIGQKESFLEFFNISFDVYKKASLYYPWHVSRCALTAIAFLLAALEIADNDKKNVIVAFSFEFAIHILLAFTLIGEKKIVGLGVSSFLSLVIAVLILLIHYFKRTNTIKFRFCFNKHIFKKIISIGTPLALMVLFNGVIGLTLNKFVIAWFGDMYIPYVTVLMFILNITCIFEMFGIGSYSLTSIYFGEKNNKGIRKVYDYVNKKSYTLSIIISLILIAGCYLIPISFGIESKKVIALSVLSLVAFGLTLCLSSKTYLYNSYYGLTKNDSLSVISKTLYGLVFSLAFSLSFGKLFGIFGVTTGLILAYVLDYIVLKIIASAKNVNEKELDMLLLENNDNKYYDYNLTINENGINELLNSIRQDLLENNIELKFIKEIETMIKKIFLIIKSTNDKYNKRYDIEKKEELLAECDIILTKKYIILITKDDGVIFDITKKSKEIEEHRSRIIANFIEDEDDKKYLDVLSFNRNSFAFEMKNKK